MKQAKYTMMTLSSLDLMDIIHQIPRTDCISHLDCGSMQTIIDGCSFTIACVENNTILFTLAVLKLNDLLK
jgi:hypothetical protein